jgi:FixJ family two-component response regulator
MSGVVRRNDPLAALSEREREVLALMAEARSNAGIADRLWVTEGTVEKHVPVVAPYAERFANHAAIALRALTERSMLVHGDIRAANMWFVVDGGLVTAVPTKPA